MQMSQDPDNQIQTIDNEVQEIQRSTYQPSESRQQVSNLYQVLISEGKNEVDLNILQNQYYNFVLTKKNGQKCSIERRYSDFCSIFEILSKKYKGYIFPAFPQNGIFAFMKSKVTPVKDKQFLNQRIKVIQRFFNIIINDPQFDPFKSNEMKQFLSLNNEFEVRKQIQRQRPSIINSSWNKFISYFKTSKESKYKIHQQKLGQLKKQYELLYLKCRELKLLLQQEIIENEKLKEHKFDIYGMQKYLQVITAHDSEQKSNISCLEKIQFELFCENEDLQMAKKVIDRIEELKNNEDNYKDLQSIQKMFGNQINKLSNSKNINKQKKKQQLAQVISSIKKIGRMK